MASIIKRKTKYSVVYTYTDSNGAKRQKWETCGSHAEAKKRKAEIEHQLDTGVFIPPSADTLSDFLDEYVSLYGVSTWAPSTFDGHTALISNYIKPIIGDVKLDDISPRMITKFYKDLQTVKAVPRYGQSEGELISPNTIREIHKLLRNAFNQAVKWELMARNPVQNATVPKAEKHERNIWDAQTLMKALSLCDDPFLSLAINLAFACSLRIGELLGLTWSCVDISQDSIDHDCAYIYIDKELQRISRESLAQIGEKGIMFKFPTMRGCNSTVLALKEPKTKTSVRKVFLPRAVSEMLVERRKTIDELKELLGMNIEIMTLYSPVPRGPLPKQITSTGPLANSSRTIISQRWYFIVSGTPARPTNLNSAVATLKPFRVTPATHRPQWSRNGMPIS